MTRVTRRRRRRRLGFLIFIVLLVGTYLLGPTPDYPAIEPAIQPLAIPLDQVEQFVADQEAKVENLRPDNHARIVWANDTAHAITEYAVVYLHGFSASPMSGDPVVTNFAKRYGMNLYMPRLAGHGIDSKESFAELTPADLVESAKDALAIGKVIGKKTIFCSDSFFLFFRGHQRPEKLFSLNR